MSKRDQRIRRIHAIRREYRAAAIALALLANELQANPSYLAPHQLRKRDADQLRKNLEATYLIRLFAEFETGLRDAWANAFHRPAHPTTQVLIDSIGARCLIFQDRIDAVHDVREYRNTLVHEGDASATAVPVKDAEQRLCQFFSFLPRDW